VSKSVRTIRIASAVAVLVGLATPSFGQGSLVLPPCSLGDTDWRLDPVFQASRDPSQRGHRVGELRCKTVDVSTWTIGGQNLRLVRAKLFEATGSDGDGIEQGVNLFILSRGLDDGATVIGRALEPYDVSRNEPKFFSQAESRPEGVIVQLDRRVGAAYLLSGDAMRRIDTHAWINAPGTRPPAGWIPGPVRNVDLRRMKGYVSLFRDGADDPARPGSAADAGQAIEFDLALAGDRFVTTGSRVVDAHSAQDTEEWTGFVSDVEELLIARQRLPAGTEPCDIGGWSADSDPAGMNLRAGPSARARVIGRIPAPWKAPDRAGDTGETYRSEFKVIGYHNGWFLVRDISAPGVAYGERYPRHLPQAPRGQGWVSARLVGAALANGSLPAGRLYQAPNEHSAYANVNRQDSPIGTGDAVERLHACSGVWGLVEVGGHRGWWRSICSNQVTNCS
jgi:hypothetical protein